MKKSDLISAKIQELISEGWLLDYEASEASAQFEILTIEEIEKI